MRRQYEDPIDTKQPLSHHKQYIPEPVKLFRQYIAMLQRDVQLKQAAQQHQLNISKQNKIKQQEINYLTLQLNQSKNLQLQLHQQAELPSIWTCCRYNILLIITLAIIMFTTMWSWAPYWTIVTSDLEIIDLNETSCSAKHPDGWQCIMPEERRPGLDIYVNGYKQRMDERGISASDILSGEKLRRCGDKPNEYASVDLSWQTHGSHERNRVIKNERIRPGHNESMFVI